MTLFSQRYFDFFNDLAQNNERPWFQENKERYEAEVAAPLICFIQAIAPYLQEISPHFVADPRRNGGSMFRIYRDTRFSKDKTPYKTHGALQFRHTMGRDVHCPGFYMHAGPNEIVVGLGIWRPESEALAKIRKAISEEPQAWLAARDDATFRKHWTLSGESLKRPPKGYAKDNPMVEDLKRKDHIAMHALTPVTFMGDNLVEEVAAMFATSKPYMQFLCKAIGIPF